MHRAIGNDDVYYVFNHTDETRDADVTFRATGNIESWNAWTGEIKSLAAADLPKQGTRLRLHLAPREAQLIVFTKRPAKTGPSPKLHKLSALSLNDAWGFELQPTLDNQFGDFRLPASKEYISAEARVFHFKEEAGSTTNWPSADFNYGDWPKVTFSYGPRFWWLGPIPPGVDTAALETQLRKLTKVDPAVPVVISGNTLKWRQYDFSLQLGIEADPYHSNPGSGPHGLKCLPKEFLELGEQDTGSVHYFWTSAVSPRTQTLPFVMGSRSSYASWINGEPAVAQPDALPPGIQSVWRFPDYDAPPHRAEVALNKGDNPLLLKFTKPTRQQMRAYAAFDLPVEDSGPGLRWFQNKNAPVFDYRPGIKEHATWYRFLSPPGVTSMTIQSRGPVQAWINGRAEKVSKKVGQTYEVATSQFSPKPSEIALRIQQPVASYEGDTILAPIQFECAKSQVSPGNWQELGLDTYSGGAWYRRTIVLTKEQAAADSIRLQLGHVACGAEIHLNGKLIAKKITPPWMVELAGAVHAGENHLEILVTNTLANHYNIGIPSMYVLKDQCTSGLLGPVELEFFGMK